MKRARYGWNSMKIGSAIIIGHRKAESARVAALLWGRRHGRKFKTRIQKNGLRIMRVR